MKNSKIKTCKYPKYTKEVPSEKSLFCIEHNRNLKEKGKFLGVAILMGATTLANSVAKKKL
ncbi:hypothetical protein [Enterococcus thailandicus]|uniref:hypothetical protein n=1 Tax=Enterococcus thailandicus TaxID=417368 RepID=UPI0022E032FC|nr:hypothetical protein [Enterococcus thailandicus]